MQNNDHSVVHTEFADAGFTHSKDTMGAQNFKTKHVTMTIRGWFVIQG